MTKEQKKKKLGNAVRAYRGSTNGVGGSWIRLPEVTKAPHVVRWCWELGIENGLEKVNSFKAYSEFYNWLRSI